MLKGALCRGWGAKSDTRIVFCVTHLSRNGAQTLSPISDLRLDSRQNLFNFKSSIFALFVNGGLKSFYTNFFRQVKSTVWKKKMNLKTTFTKPHTNFTF